MRASIQCYVYKGNKKSDTYLFTVREDDFSDVPETLLVLMGDLEQVLSLVLDKSRKLANADAPTVIAQLKSQGFFLQVSADSNFGIIA